MLGNLVLGVFWDDDEEKGSRSSTSDVTAERRGQLYVWYDIYLSDDDPSQRLDTTHIKRNNDSNFHT
jgi:hypothetical protein